MKKKLISLLLATTMTVSLFSGCGKSSDSEDSSELGDEVNILVWDGSYDEALWKGFEKETGVHVNISYINNTDEILAKLLASGGSSEYDFIDLESAYIKPFVENELLEELNWDNIPNDANTDSEVKAMPGDEKNKYTCSNGFKGYTTIMYNKETCPIEIKTFKDLADPALEGQVESVLSTITLFGLALNGLGYEPDSTTESEYAEAAKLWKDIKKNVKLFSGSTYQALLDGEVSVAIGYDYPLLEATADDPEKYAVAEIEEGTESYSTAWAVPKGAEHKKEAEALMNYMLEPKQVASRFEFYPSWCYNDAGWKLVSDEVKSNPTYTSISEEWLDKSWMVPVSDEAIEYMDKYLTEFMSGNE